jgi:hypothetical protein
MQESGGGKAKAAYRGARAWTRPTLDVVFTAAWDTAIERRWDHGNGTVAAVPLALGVPRRCEQGSKLVLAKPARMMTWPPPCGPMDCRAPRGPTWQWADRGPTRHTGSEVGRVLSVVALATG